MHNSISYPGKVNWQKLFVLPLLCILSLVSPFQAQASDPEYQWTKEIQPTEVGQEGNPNGAFGSRIVTDSQGNIYVGGSWAQSVDFNPDAGTDTKTTSARGEVFLTKINADGTYGWTKVTKTTEFTNPDTGYSNETSSDYIKVDADQNIYIVGLFRGTVDFNPESVADNKTSVNNAGNYLDMFITKINADGSYAWTKTIPGADTYIADYKLDSHNNLYLTGYYSGNVDFDPGSGVDIHTTHTDSQLSYVTKINADGSYAWTRTPQADIYRSGYGYASGSRLGIDLQDDVYVEGEWGRIVDFDPSTATDTRDERTDGPIFFSKYTADGTYSWTKTPQRIDTKGSSFQVFRIGFDSQNNMFVTGNYQGTADFDPGPGTDIKSSTSAQMFLMKSHNDGSYAWTKVVQGESSESGSQGTSLAFDSLNNIYMPGVFVGTIDFNPGIGDVKTGGYSTFLTAYDNSGGYLWTVTKSGEEGLYDVATDPSNNLYTLGGTSGSNAITKISKYSLGIDVTPTPEPNVPPTVGAISVANSIKVNTVATANASFTDLNPLDSHTAEWNWGDGSTSEGIVTEASGSGAVTGEHAYSLSGNYVVTLTVTDNHNASGEQTASVEVVSNDPVTLYPIADSYLKQGSANENEGASTFVRLRSAGHNRALIKFDQSQIQTAIGGAQNYTAKLQFTISDNENNWGKTGRSIALHRLLQDWTEGNGFIDGNTPSNRGTGAGATWNCATDSNIHNQASNCNGSTDWDMTSSNLWPFAAAATATTTITNNQSGIVEFDVTSEVQSYMNHANQNYGWLLKKVDEEKNGNVQFGTKESANTPKLIISFK